MVHSSKLQAKALTTISNLLPISAAVSFMDLSVEAECFGSEIRYFDDEIPTVVGGIVYSEEDAEALLIPRIGDGRTDLYIETVRMAGLEITDRPVFAGSIGPFSMAGRLMEVSEAMVNCYEEPDMVHTLLRKCTSFLIDYILAFKETGANGVLMAEPLAGMLSPSLAAEFSTPYVKEIVEAVQDDSFAVIYHNCGDNVIYMAENIFSCGAMAYHFGNAIAMEDIMKKAPDDVLVMGNLDPVGEIKNGSPKSIHTSVYNLMDKCGGYQNYILSSGCDIPPTTPWENIKAILTSLEEYYQFKKQ